MEIALRRFIIALCIGTLSVGISQILPGSAAYGKEDGDDESGDEDAGEEETQDLSVKMVVDSTKVNPKVRDRYKIYAKVDPQKKESKRFLFDLEDGKKTKGNIKFKGVSEGKSLQLFVVKDNFQRDCTTTNKKLMSKIKDSVVKGMPSFVYIKLIQDPKYLKEKDMKKFSGVNAVPSCVITGLKFGE